MQFHLRFVGLSAESHDLRRLHESQLFFEDVHYIFEDIGEGSIAFPTSYNIVFVIVGLGSCKRHAQHFKAYERILDAIHYLFGVEGRSSAVEAAQDVILEDHQKHFLPIRVEQSRIQSDKL